MANEERKARQRKYNRKWRTANPEKHRASVLKWKLANPERQRELHRKWVRKNPERVKTFAKEWRTKNHERAKQQTREWKQRNPERAKEWKRLNPLKVKGSQLKHAYGITLEEYQAMLRSQHHKCAACDVDLTQMPTNQIHIDHCHTTGAIRGILCGSCNRALGLMRDNPVRLRKLADYVERFATLSLSSRTD